MGVSRCGKCGERMSLEVRRKICAIGIVIGVYLGFRYVVPVAVPFLIGWLLAVWVYPAGEWIERKIHLKKSWAGAVILVGLLTLFLLLLWKGGILLWEQIKLIFLNFHNLSDWGMRILDQCCQAAEQVTGIKKEVSRQFILTQAGQMQRNLMESVTPQSFLKLISEAGEKILTKKDVEAFVDAGADVILLPAPGTVPGITMEYARKLIKKAHEKGALAMTTIGTSQEGADEATIRQIALMCKMAGADIHHIGDSGYMGMALPENITAYSVAIRGKRHTYRRMAMSLLR